MDWDKNLAAKTRNNSKLKSAGVLFLPLIKVSVGNKGPVMSVQISLQDTAFRRFLYIPRSGIAGTYQCYV